MKILIISSGFCPVTNNISGAIERLIETYLIANDKKYNHEIVLYSVKTKNSNEELKFKFTDIRQVDKTTFLYKFKQLYFKIKDQFSKEYCGNAFINEVKKDLINRKELNKYDAIIIENIVDFVPFVRNIYSGKLILHLHNDYLNIKTKNAQQIVSAASEIWCVSGFIAGEVKKIIESKDKVKILYNGINLDDFKQENDVSENEKLKNKLNISKNDKVFIYIGRLMKIKGVRELIIAFKKLSKEYPNIKLLILGGTRKIGINEDKYVKDLYKIADKKVIFLGNIKHEELYKYYAISDCQIIPSLWKEAFGLIALEGMASNIPMIVSNVGGLPEVTADSVLYVEKKDIINNLLEAMKKTINNEIDYQEMIKKYKMQLNKFSEENYCNNFNNLLK